MARAIFCSASSNSAGSRISGRPACTGLDDGRTLLEDQFWRARPLTEGVRVVRWRRSDWMLSSRSTTLPFSCWVTGSPCMMAPTPCRWRSAASHISAACPPRGRCPAEGLAAHGRPPFVVFHAWVTTSWSSRASDAVMSPGSSPRPWGDYGLGDTIEDNPSGHDPHGDGEGIDVRTGSQAASAKPRMQASVSPTELTMLSPR